MFASEFLTYKKMGIVKDILYKTANIRFLKTFKNQTIFPYYHIVSDDKVAHVEHLYEFKNCFQFNNDIDLFLKNYNPIDPADLLSNKYGKNSFLLSFDDGLQEVYTVVYPILKRHNLKAIFFINPNFIDNNQGLYKHYISILISHLKTINFPQPILNVIAQKLSFTYNSVDDFKNELINIKFSDKHKINEVLKIVEIDIARYLKVHTPYITKEQIQEMIDDGFLFGGHTMSHPPLNQLTFSEQKKEIIDSIDWLKDNFNIKYSLFAFPFSDKNVSKKLIDELFRYDPNILLFGNSGLKKDTDERLIQRFSLENPNKVNAKQIVTENLYKYFNKLIGKYFIKRK